MSARTRTREERAARQMRRRRKQRRPARPASMGEQLLALWSWLLPGDEIFAGLKVHGNTSWRHWSLVWLALCWSWSELPCVTDAFVAAEWQCRSLGVVSLKTYQGLMNALTTWTGTLLPVLWSVLQARMEQIGGRWWRVGGWVLIAFDGSRSSAPRTVSAERAFCAPTYGKGKTARYRRKKSKGMRRKRNQASPPQPQEPQVWITLLWHMGLRLPWCWRLGPSNSSERGHVMEMLDEVRFPDQTLFCGDAGFVGYPLWSKIRACGRHFLVRVGGNVNLLGAFDCSRDEEGTVWCWPQEAQKAGEPPLRLRLLQVTIGRTKVWMLTSVCDATQLSRADATNFYKMRWGIEVEFRGLKQTLDRASLRCRNERRLLVELHWSLLAMAVAELLALKEQLGPAAEGRGVPSRRSLAQTMRVLRRCLHRLHEAPTATHLRTQLREALTDDYHRTSSKRARYRPPNPDKKPLGDPTVRPPTPTERGRLRQYEQQKAA